MSAIVEFLNPVDVHVGSRIRAARTFRDVEISRLAGAIGISTAHLIDYEAGNARCLAIHLAAIAKALNVRCPLFFQGLSRKAEKPHQEMPRISSMMAQFQGGANDNELNKFGGDVSSWGVQSVLGENDLLLLSIKM